MSIQFFFPERRQQVELIQSREQLLQKLINRTGMFNCINFYRVYQRTSLYIYAQCKQCSSKLSYKWSTEDQKFILKTYNNRHIHSSFSRGENELNQFISQIPFHFQLSTAKKIAIKQFGISPSKFYHRYRKLKLLNRRLSQIIKQLQKRDYQIMLQPFPLEENQLPSILILTNPNMKKLMRTYGQSVCYDITYNVVEERTNENKQYGVGLFVGVNCFNHIVPFAITIINDQTTDSFAKLFQSFIGMCGQPRSFITDQQSSLISSIKKLQRLEIYQGSHIYDSFHVLRNFQKISKRIDLMGQLSLLIREQSRLKFKLKVQEFRSKLQSENQYKAFQIFMNKSQNVCFSQTPQNSFFIINPSTSISQKTNHLMKLRMRRSKKYTDALQILVSFSEQLIKSSENQMQLYDQKIEELFEDQNLRICRYQISKRPMQYFVKQYVQSLKIEAPTHQGNIYLFNQYGQRFVCQIGQSNISCNCGITIRTGISCRHIISVCRTRNIAYTDTIHPRWKYSRKPQNIIDKKHRKYRQTLKSRPENI